MKKSKQIIILIVCFISSLLIVKGIYGYFTMITEPKINKFTIVQSTSYTIKHELMNLDGSTYTLYQEESHDGIPIGTTVTPEVLSINGFTPPAKQTITLDSTENKIITYQYTRNQYNLTIKNSNLVTTDTPSGTYYYGQEIHLIANDTNNEGNPFVKWTNDITNQDYTFILKDNTIIGPIYANSYTVTFEKNNGESPSTKRIIKNETIGTMPTIKNDDCLEGEGDYWSRQCTYFYKFEGWYSEPTFINEINEEYIPTKDMTLYAKWSKIFYGHHGTEEFDGTNYIDTGIKMFSEENAKKDFIITFTVNTNNGYSTTNSGDRGTIFTNMNEKADPYPGVHFYSQGTDKYTMNINIAGRKVKDNNTGYNIGEKVIIKKENGIVYYSYDDGQFIQINDFSDFNSYFNNNATFGAGTKSNGVIYRYFKGTLSDMSIELIDLPSYIIHFDPNGGNGTMIDQQIKIGETTTLKSNLFTHTNGTFDNWNTEPDGSGTTYTNKQSITDLASQGETITLYAQWKDPFHYNIHFDSNGGTGTMENQSFIYNSVPIALSKNTFTKEGYIFTGWNTEVDGSGTYYNDEEKVSNLSEIDNDTITLYAQYLKISYINNGSTTFDGTINTFIDTGVNLYSQETIDKDFEIKFTIDEIDENGMNQYLPTIFNGKDESNEVWPGFCVRINKFSAITPVYKWNNTIGQSTILANIPFNKVPINFTIRRRNGVVTLSYNYEGYENNNQVLYDQANWTLDKYYQDNASFGGIYNENHQPDRFFTGKLSNMLILLGD